MNDHFLYELREPPPAAFAARLQRRLDRQPSHRARSIKLLLGCLLFGTAFAFFYRGARQEVRPVDVAIPLTREAISKGSARTLEQPRATVSAPTDGNAHDSEVTSIPQRAVQASSSRGPLVPAHWRMVELRGLPTSPADHEFASDFVNAWNGSASAFLRVKDPRTRNLAVKNSSTATCILQGSQVLSFRAKRVELAAQLKTDATSKAGLSMWVYDANGVLLIQQGPWDSTWPQWTAASVVMDVPENAAAMLYGACLQRTGSLWIDDVSLNVVGSDMPLRGTPHVGAPATAGQATFLPPNLLLPEPANLDFEDTTNWTPDFAWEVFLKQVSSFAEH
jgi:hypothetical protein